MGSKNGTQVSDHAVRHALKVGALTFLIAIFVTLPAREAMEEWPLYLAVPVLLFIIFIGVMFDIIGTAVTVADERGFHALSSKRMTGADVSIALVRNADRVSNLTNDIIGDLAGTISGAAAAALVLQLAVLLRAEADLVNMLLVGVAAALTVGGKAAGKAYAIRNANSIIQRVGRVVAWIQDVLHIRVVPEARPRRTRKRGRAE